MSVLGMQTETGWLRRVMLPSRRDHNKLEKVGWQVSQQVQQGRVQSSASGKEHVMNQHKLAKHLCRERSEGSAVYQVEHEPAKYLSDKDKWYLSYSRKSVSSNMQKLTGHCPGQLAVGGLAWADTFDQMTSWGPFPTQSFWDSMILWYHFWKYTKILFISIT